MDHEEPPIHEFDLGQCLQGYLARLDAWLPKVEKDS